MPITENNFTDAEFLSAIEANPTLVEVVSKSLGQKEYVVKTKKDFDNIESDIASRHTSRFATEFEKTIAELTGIPKASPDQKYTDYYKTVTSGIISEKKALAEELSALKAKSSLSDAEKAQMELLKQRSQEYDTFKSESEKKIGALKATFQIQTEVGPSMSKLVKDDKLKRAIEIVHRDAMDYMSNNSQIDPHSGKVIFFKDGKAQFNEDGTYKTSAQVYEEAMADFLDNGKQASGAGGNGGGGNAGDNPAGITNLVQLTVFLNKKGLVSGTTEFNKEFNRLKGNLPPR